MWTSLESSVLTFSSFERPSLVDKVPPVDPNALDVVVEVQSTPIHGLFFMIPLSLRCFK